MIKIGRATLRFLIALWRTKCLLLVLIASLSMASLLMYDAAERGIRLKLLTIAPMDYAGEARDLVDTSDYKGALIVLNAGLDHVEPERRDELQKLKAEIQNEQDSWLRRGKDLLYGAATGDGQNLESASAAILMDMFVIGDLRDLLIESGQALTGGSADKMIIALSAIGIVTTAGPPVDAGVAMMKLLRKAGAINDRLASKVIRLITAARRKGDWRAVHNILGDITLIGQKLSGPTMRRVLRDVNGPEDMAKLAQFLRQNQGGAYAMQVAGPEGLQVVLKRSPRAQDALVAACRKGQSGIALMRQYGMRLFRVHPLQGFVKTIYKGNHRPVIAYLDRSGKGLLVMCLGIAAACFYILIGNFRRACNHIPYTNRYPNRHLSLIESPDLTRPSDSDRVEHGGAGGREFASADIPCHNSVGDSDPRAADSSTSDAIRSESIQ